MAWPLAPFLRSAGAFLKPIMSSLSAYFVADAVVRTSQNVEEMAGGQVWNSSIAMLPEETLQTLNENKDKQTKNGALVTALVAVLAWELTQQFITKKRR